MSFSLTTKRLQLHVENESIADKVLEFYVENSLYFDTVEPTRPENFYTLTYQEAALKYEHSETIKGHTIRYFVYKKNNPDVIIGSVNFSKIQGAPFSCATIGYKFHHDYWGYGYATESCQAAINMLFNNYRIHRIEGRVAPDNIPSIHVLERLGFTYEGLEYKSVEVNGVFTDHLRYSLLNNDFR